jgi:hypothetical protein
MDQAITIAATRPAEQSGVSKAYQSLSTVSEASRLLRQTIIGLCSRSRDARFSSKLAGLLDHDVVVGELAERAASQLGSTGASLKEIRTQLTQAAPLCAVLKSDLTLLAQAEQAAVLMADRANLQAIEVAKPSDPAAAARLKQALDHARSDQARSLSELSINTSADVDNQLQNRIDNTASSDSIGSLNLLELSRRWASVSAAQRQNLFFPARLDAAAAIQSVRADSDPAYVRDLQLTSRAARAGEASPSSRADHDIVAALASILQEHEYNHPASDILTSEARSAFAASGEQSRRLLRRIAGQAEVAALPSTNGVELPEPPAEPKIDRQNQVAQAIEHAGQQYDSQQSIKLIQSAQERLAALPQALIDLKKAAENRHLAAEKEATAKQNLARAGPTSRPVAERIEKQSQSDLNEASASLAEAIKAVGAERISQLGQNLRKHGTEPGGAGDLVNATLTPVLNAAVEAARLGDADAMEKSADQARVSMSQIQDELRRAQSQLIQRDPVVSAKIFSESLAAPLGPQNSSPTALNPDQALSKAWQDVVRDAAANRLANTLPGAAAHEADPPEYRDAINEYFAQVYDGMRLKP